jgi:hypothetical protein
VTPAKGHLSEYGISDRLMGTVGGENRRWLVIWNALVDPRPAIEIAGHTGISVSTVHNVISLYNRYGPFAVERAKESKPRRCYFSREEEARFGEICVAGRLKLALEEYLGHAVHHSTARRQLHLCIGVNYTCAC